MPGKGFQFLGMCVDCLWPVHLIYLSHVIIPRTQPRLSNDKPSAIFRIKNAAFSTSNVSNMQIDITSLDTSALLGISIEPLASVLAQVSTLPSNANALVLANPSLDPAYLAQKIVGSLLNYLQSFDPVRVVGGTGIMVKMSELERWYDKFVTRIKNEGIGFLTRSE